jgi:glycosyltransferase involved in cell wall biosynthesis
MNNNPKVSIISTTYNHEKYIRAALDGFIAQKTNFSFEVIIADDHSKDKTPKIIQEYADKYPHLIKTIIRSKNMGVVANMVDVLQRARGKYIAICEGDDFWTDEKKLQTQVDFMDSHPDCALCFHPVRVFFEKGEQEDAIFPAQGDHFTVSKLLERNFIQTNSVMYRAQKNYGGLAMDVMPYDWYLHLYHAQFGKIGFIDRVMSAYRRHEEGAWWNSTNEDKSKFWNMHGRGYVALYVELLKMYSKTEYRKTITDNIKNVYQEIKHANHNEPHGIAGGIVGKYPLANEALIDALIDKEAKQDDSISEKNAEIETLHVKVAEIENSLATIKQSRLWKYRNKIARYINRGAI